MECQARLAVVHLVDAMGSGQELWGKERVVQLLMREQRASGAVEPRLVTFRPCHLRDILADEGFRTDVLGPGADAAVPLAAAAALGRLLSSNAVAVVHSHGYKANVVARGLRVCGRARGTRIVSTSHGFVDADLKLRFYNAVDRLSSVASDVTTVPDPGMLRSFPRLARTRYVANGVPDVAPDDLRAEPLGFERGVAEYVAGTLGRISAEKGIPELLEAARACPDPSVAFAVAGVGAFAEQVRRIGGNVRYAGYVRRPHAYLSALDVYVQASRSEGLSLALLEAMRAGKPIVATDVGATREAVDDGESALLVPPFRGDRLLEAVLVLRNDPELAQRLGRSARRRFERDFQLRVQHERFLALYQGDRR